MDGIVLPPSPNWYGTSLADWSADGAWHAYAAHNAVVLLRPGERRIAHMLVTAVAFVPAAGPAPLSRKPPQQQRLVSGSADKTLRLWDAATRRTLKISRRLPSEVMCLVVTRDGTTAVAGCRGGELAVWRIAGDKIASKPTVIKTGLPTSVCVIAVSPVAPDEVALGVADGGLLLFDIARGVPTARLQGFRGDVQSLAWARFRLPQHKSDPPAQPAGAAPEGGLGEGAGGAAPQPPEAAGAAAPHGLSPAAGEAHVGTAGPSGSEEQVLRLPGAQDASIGGGGIGGGGGGGGGLEDIEVAHPDPVRGADLSQLEADFERLGQRRERQAHIAAAHSRHAAAAGDAALAEASTASAGASRGSVEPDEPSTLASVSAAAACVEAGDSPAAESAEAATTETVPAPAGAQHEQAGEPAGAAARAAAAAEPAQDEPAAYCDLLAAGARDGIVQIWDCRSHEAAAAGHSAVFERPAPRRRHVLTLPKPGGLSAAQAGRVWVAAAWLPQAPPYDGSAAAQLVCSGLGGSMLAWSVPLAAPTEPPALPPSTRLPPHHSRIVFSISFGPLQQPALPAPEPGGYSARGASGEPGELGMLTTSMDRSAALWRLGRAPPHGDAWKIVLWPVSGLGGHAYALAAQPGGGTVAVGCGDHTVRLLRPAAGATSTAAVAAAPDILWQGIPDAVTALAWHPYQTHVLALGCSNGAVALLDTLKGVAAPFVTRHKAPVTGVAWRRLPAPAPADGCGSTAVLHSLCGAGRLLQWGGSDAKEALPAASAKPVDIAPDVTAGIQGAAAAQLTAIAFHPGGGRLALGDLSGAVSVAEAAPGGGWQPAAALQPAGGAAISALAWHPAAAAVPTGAAPDAASVGWLAAAADDGNIAVFLHADGQAAVGAAPASLTAHTGADAALAVAWCPAGGGSTLAVACADATVQVYGVVNASGAPAGAAATPPQLQRLRTLRGHAGRVRSLAWAGRNGGDAAASSESAAEAAGSNRGDSEPLVTLLSGSEDQTVRAWTVDPDQWPPAAPDAATAAAPSAFAPAPSSQTSTLAHTTAATASDAAEESPLQPPPPQPPLPQRQQSRMLRPPSLADGMVAACGADDTSSAAAARQQPPAPQRLDSSHREGSASGELHTLAAVAAASPGHLRFGGLPPELPSPTRTQSAAWAPPAVPHVTASAVSAEMAAPSGPRAAVDAEVAATRSATLPAAQASAQTQHGSTRAAPAAGAVAGASAALPPAGKRSRQQKAVSLGARLLLPTAAGLDSQTAAEPDAAAQAAALHACLQLSARLYGSSEGGAAGGRGSDAARRQGGAHPAAPAGSDIFESPLEAAAALLAAASQLQQGGAVTPAEAHRAAALQLWAGDVTGALHTVLVADALTADFVNMSVAAGKQAWRAAVAAYAAQLEARGEAQLAALQLLAAGDAAGALAVLRRAGLLAEAAALGAARLMPGDPALQEVQRLRGAQLEAGGAFEAAASCFLPAGAPAAAAAALARRGTRDAVSAAARIAAEAAAAADGGHGAQQAGSSGAGGGNGDGSQLAALASQLAQRAAELRAPEAPQQQGAPVEAGPCAEPAGGSAGPWDTAAMAVAAGRQPTTLEPQAAAGADEPPAVVFSSSSPLLLKTTTGGSIEFDSDDVPPPPPPMSPPLGSQQIGSGRTGPRQPTSRGEVAAVGGRVSGADAADAAASAPGKDTIPMSRALAMRPRQTAGATSADAGGASGFAPPGQRRRYTSGALLGVCGNLARAALPGQGFVAPDRAHARMAELDILLPELPPPPQGPPPPPEDQSPPEPLPVEMEAGARSC